MSASGASDQIRHLNKTVKPIVEYSREGDEYVAKATAPGLNKEHTHKFRLNVELDETTLDGRKVKVKSIPLPVNLAGGTPTGSYSNSESCW